MSDQEEKRVFLFPPPKDPASPLACPFGVFLHQIARLGSFTAEASF